MTAEGEARPSAEVRRRLSRRDPQGRALRRYDEIWQAFVMGDGRTYDQACALRAVTSSDGMTADYYPFDHAFFGRAASRIFNEVRRINRVTYDITSKPPGTIEWE